MTRRTCKACDGTRVDRWLDDRRYSPRFPHHPACEAHPTSVFACECPAPPCPACLGSGQIEDRIPAADAIADAETLHTYAWDGGAEVGDLTPAYLDAAAVDLREDELLDDFAAPIAESAARAAFRAVPGLRD